MGHERPPPRYTTPELIRRMEDRIMQELANLRHDLRHVFRHLERNMGILDDKINEIVTEQTAETDAIMAVENTIRALADAIASGNNDPALQAKLDGIKSTVMANASRLAAAALAGTPAAPPA